MAVLPFTRAGFSRGFRLCLPVAFSVFAYGLVFGVLSRQAGLGLPEALFMSGLVFAGASQFVALELWAAPLPVATIILTTLILNLRHMLMGAAIRPWFAGLPARQSYPSLFFMTDENWALTMREVQKGELDRAFLIGGGIAVFFAWFLATLGGQLLGAIIPNPAAIGLDFAFTAVFLALLVGMWTGRGDLLPWVVAALVAVAASFWLPGKWYIVLGGLAGSLVGAVRDGH